MVHTTSAERTDVGGAKHSVQGLATDHGGSAAGAGRGTSAPNGGPRDGFDGGFLVDIETTIARDRNGGSAR